MRHLPIGLWLALTAIAALILWELTDPLTRSLRGTAGATVTIDIEEQLRMERVPLPCEEGFFTTMNDCYPGMEYAQAVALCGMIDGRLCTRNELLDGAAKWTGCDFDQYYVWSATPCGALDSDSKKHFAVQFAPWETRRATCTADDTGVAVRCCGIEGAENGGVSMIAWPEEKCADRQTKVTNRM